MLAFIIIHGLFIMLHCWLAREFIRRAIDFSTLDAVGTGGVVQNDEAGTRTRGVSERRMPSTTARSVVMAVPRQNVAGGSALQAHATPPTARRVRKPTATPVVAPVAPVVAPGLAQVGAESIYGRVAGGRPRAPLVPRPTGDQEGGGIYGGSRTMSSAASTRLGGTTSAPSIAPAPAEDIYAVVHDERGATQGQMHSPPPVPPLAPPPAPRPPLAAQLSNLGLGTVQEDLYAVVSDEQPPLSRPPPAPPVPVMQVSSLATHTSPMTAQDLPPPPGQALPLAIPSPHASPKPKPRPMSTFLPPPTGPPPSGPPSDRGLPAASPQIEAHEDEGETTEHPAEEQPSGFDPAVTHIQVVALYDYEAVQPDELSFVENEIIFVVRKNEDDWFEGFIDGDPTRHGMFPGVCVYIYILPVYTLAPVYISPMYIGFSLRRRSVCMCVCDGWLESPDGHTVLLCCWISCGMVCILTVAPCRGLRLGNYVQDLTNA